MSFWEKLSKMDNRIIYTALLVIMIWALIWPMGLPIQIGTSAKAAYETFDSFESGDILYVSFDYDSAGATDIQSSIEACMRLVLKNGGRVVSGALWPIGAQQANYAFKKMQEEYPHLVEGVDFLNLGYKPGGQMYIEKAMDSLIEACANVDNEGRNLSQFPIMKDLVTLKDAKVVICGNHGSPGASEWVPMYATAYAIPNNKPFVVAASAVNATINAPFIQSGQITVYLNGIRAGAEMELLTEKKGTAVSGMDAQSLSHILVFVLMILGNVSYFMQKRESRKQ
ncbi:MAG: hypothetical protein GX138_00310 [Firmicutes bacterium]|jgi:hypothetical protein|nr:hypothetical protein [Bacillota bacterium]